MTCLYLHYTGGHCPCVMTELLKCSTAGSALEVQRLEHSAFSAGPQAQSKVKKKKKKKVAGAADELNFKFCFIFFYGLTT